LSKCVVASSSYKGAVVDCNFAAIGVKDLAWMNSSNCGTMTSAAVCSLLLRSCQRELCLERSQNNSLLRQTQPFRVRYGRIIRSLAAVFSLRLKDSFCSSRVCCGVQASTRHLTCAILCVQTRIVFVSISPVFCKL